MNDRELDNLVNFDQPAGIDVERFNDIKEAARLFAQVIVDSIPSSASRGTCLWMVRQAAIKACDVLASGESA